MRLVIASRKSDLARIQAYTVGDALKKKFPNLEIQFEFRESLGDKNLSDPLWKMPERGVFTEDFYQGLVSGKWDMVVHSWKDLPVEDRPDTTIAATMARADVRDVLLFKRTSLENKKKDLVIFTSSPRRIYNLGACLDSLLPIKKSNLKFESVRGNVQTRVRKLLEGDVDGLVLAKAGLDRLLSAEREEFSETKNFLRDALKQLYWMVLPVSLNPTAAAQGALAIEVATANKKVLDLVKAIHSDDTFKSVVAERQQLKQWGGGCHQKIGINIFERDYGTVVMARGVRDTGEVIDIRKLQPEVTVVGPFQENVKTATWFERESLPPQDYSAYDAHWVARAVALPQDVSFDPAKTLLWTSGVETWKNLAARGLWVNGTSDSLGEQEAPLIELIDGRLRKWCKWTHAEGEEFPLGPFISSYKLVPKDTPPELDPKADHFFWMSGSSFERAVKVYPWLIEKTNWSGPGNTHKRIKKALENHSGKGVARIALNLEQWQKIKASR